MDETTREKVLSILKTASEAMLNSLRVSNRSVLLQCEHHQYPDSELCAWGTFKTPTEVVSLCLTVQGAGDSYHIVGDICYEDGRIVRDVLERWVDSDEKVLQVVREFVAEWSAHVEAVAIALRGESGG